MSNHNLVIGSHTQDQAQVTIIKKKLRGLENRIIVYPIIVFLVIAVPFAFFTEANFIVIDGIVCSVVWSVFILLSGLFYRRSLFGRHPMIIYLIPLLISPLCGLLVLSLFLLVLSLSPPSTMTDVYPGLAVIIYALCSFLVFLVVGYVLAIVYRLYFHKISLRLPRQ